MKSIYFLLLCISLTACATTTFTTSISAPVLDHTTYKTIDSTNKIASVYFYYSGFNPENGDIIMKAIMNRMGGKAVFYTCDVRGFPGEDSLHVTNNIIGSNVLPSYIFYRDNKIVSKVSIRSAHTREQAEELAQKLYNEFRERNWYQSERRR